MMSAMGDNMTQEDLDTMIRLVDKNGDGAIEYNGMLGCQYTAFTLSTVKQNCNKYSQYFAKYVADGPCAVPHEHGISIIKLNNFELNTTGKKNSMVKLKENLLFQSFTPS